MMVWKITEDKTNPTNESEIGTWGNRNGVCLIRNGKVKGVTHAGESICPLSDDELAKGHKFQIKDDDGEIYYIGYMTRELADSCDVLRPLDDFATPNAGATTLEIWDDKKKVWEIV